MRGIKVKKGVESRGNLSNNRGRVEWKPSNNYDGFFRIALGDRW